MRRYMMLLIFVLIVALGTVSAATMFRNPWKLISEGRIEVADETGDILGSRLDESMQDRISDAIGGELDDQGVEIAPAELENYQDELGDGRPDIIEPAKTFCLDSANKIEVAVVEEDIEVTVDDMGESKTAALSRIEINGQERIILRDPDYSQLSFMKSKNDHLILLYTATGMWKFNHETDTVEKISKDAFEGRTFQEIGNEFYKTVRNFDGEDYRKPLFWIGDINVNSEGSRIAYITNRDVDEFVGNSIWLFSVETGKENRLIGGDERVFSILGWYKNDLLFVFYSENGEKHHAMITLEGELYPMDELDPAFSLHDVFDDKVIYQDKSNEGDRFKIGRIDYLTGKIADENEIFVDGVIIDSALVNREHDMVMAVYESNDQPTQFNIAVYDLLTKELYDIECPDGYQIIKSQWIKDSSLLIVLMNSEGLESTWMYSMKR